jgi:hypothetical protein
VHRGFEMTEVLDAAKRVADIINGQAIAQPFDVLIRSVMAFSLEDGQSDGVLYDSQTDAMARQSRPCMYLSLREAPGGILPMQAQSILTYWRMIQDAGGGPESGPRAMVMPLAREDMLSQMKRMLASSGRSAERYKGR